MKSISLRNGVYAILIPILFAFAVIQGCKKTNLDDNLQGVSGLKAAKTAMDVPTLSLASATQVSITLQVCAPAGTGATGATAGFSIQWLTEYDFINVYNRIWPSSDNPNLCKGSFSGNANLSRYNLNAGECVNVNIGEFLFDEGASTNCDGQLACDTRYVFRIFAHATNKLNRSDFSQTYTFSTLPCDGGPLPGCTYTQGYWKTHGIVPVGGNSNQWTLTSLDLGTVNYTDLQLLSIFNQAAAGNGLVALSHQLIAAKFNVNKNGAASTDPGVLADIAAADALIGNKIVPPVGAGYLAPAVSSPLTTALTNYNEGTRGTNHCQ